MKKSRFGEERIAYAPHPGYTASTMRVWTRGDRPHAETGGNAFFSMREKTILLRCVTPRQAP